MIFWYEHLYLQQELVKDEEKCKKIIWERCRHKKGIVKKVKENLAPWKENYELLIVANNPDNLFEIINTNQMFFRHYERQDIYVIGIAKSYAGAVEMVRQIMTKGYGDDLSFEPRELFRKEYFVEASK